MSYTEEKVVTQSFKIPLSIINFIISVQIESI